MPHDRLSAVLKKTLGELAASGRAKGAETIVRGVVPAGEGRGPRFLLEGEGEREFLRMNSNSYLGLSLNPDMLEAEDHAVNAFGTGPGAVRFISGTWGAHVALEKRLAAFHGRPTAMIFSSAYATVMGTLPALISDETCVISDALNHNCIINAIRLARPRERHVYAHLDLGELEALLRAERGRSKRVIVVTDGIFSMRGDHAPLDQIMALAEKYDADFPENIAVVVDDSHGVGAFGASGRGTEEHTASPPVDVLIGTLGKAFGVNGGYVTGAAPFIDYLRETSPFYIYSNPITPGEAVAAAKAVDIVDSGPGRQLLDHLRAMTVMFEKGLGELGLETIPGAHPVVPLMVRDTAKTSALVKHLRANGILATGLNFPVVPKGDEEIRFQISADHTEGDIAEALQVLASFGKG